MYNETTVIRVCEVIDLKFEVKLDFQGHLEAAMDMEVMKMAFRLICTLISRYLRSLSSILRSNLASEAVWRWQWPK